MRNISFVISTFQASIERFRGNFGSTCDQQSESVFGQSQQIPSDSKDLRLPCPFEPNPRRMQTMPSVECPVVIRAWLETQMRRNVRCLSQSANYSDRKRSMDRVLMRGCCCSRLEPPTVTDRELDVFLEQVVPVEQAIVMAIFDSQ